MSKKEVLEFNLVNIEELSESESKSLQEIATLEDLQVVQEPELDGPTRSLAYIKFVLCRSLPAVNRNGACWTYATLKNSLKTVTHQVIDLNHSLEQNSDLLKKKVPNIVVGHMISAEIAENVDDQLIPSEPVPMIVKGVINKRLAPDLIERIKNGEKLKISMECEYEDMGFLYNGKLFKQRENEELWDAYKKGKKELDGKPFVRVLGGVSPQGGIVNFWGAAVLVGEPPADPAAEIKSAIALEEVDLHPPQSVINNFKKGIDLHEDGHSGDGLKPETVRWAKRIVSGEPLTKEKVRKMSAWHARHAVDKKTGWHNPPTPGYVASLLWGGDEGRAWSDKMVKRLDRAEESASGEENTQMDEQENAQEVLAESAADKVGHLTPPTMVTDDIEKINHEDLSLAEEDNAKIKEDVEKDVEEKVNSLMSLGTKSQNPTRAIIQPDNPDIDPNDLYADPGYTGDKTPKFPLDTKQNVLDAICFFSSEENRREYTVDQCSLIDKRVSSAASDMGLSPVEIRATLLKDVANFVTDASEKAQPEAVVEATEANTREESTMSETTENKAPKAAAASEANAELAATKKAIIDTLSQENATLKDQLTEMAKKIDDMKKEQEARAKRDRASVRKQQLASKISNMNEKLDSSLASFLLESDDDEFESFKAIAEAVYDLGVDQGKFIADKAWSEGNQKAPSQDEMMASQGEATPYTRKVSVIDPNPPAATLPAASGNPDTLKEAATVTPYAPVGGAEIASISAKKKNRFAGM